MNKSEIEKIALEVCNPLDARKIGTYGVCEFAHRFLSRIDAERVKHDHGHVSLAHELWAAAQLMPDEGITDGVDRIAAILAREDAERGKAAVAWVDTLDIARPRCVTSLDYRSLIEAELGVEYVPLFRSPTIPEGMCLVPIEPTNEICSLIHDISDDSGEGWQRTDAEDYWSQLISVAAQGERK